MKDLFSVPQKLKKGKDGKTRVLIPPDQIQNTPELVQDWIRYATLDAKVQRLQRLT